MRLSLESPVEEATDVPVTVAVADGATRQVPFGSSGVEGACARRQGFLRELGRSGHFHGIPAVHRVAATSNTPAQRRRVGSSTWNRFSGTTTDASKSGHCVRSAN